MRLKFINSSASTLTVWRRSSSLRGAEYRAEFVKITFLPGNLGCLWWWHVAWWNEWIMKHGAIWWKKTRPHTSIYIWITIIYIYVRLLFKQLRIRVLTSKRKIRKHASKKEKNPIFLWIWHNAEDSGFF